MNLGISDNATFPDAIAPSLELGLDQRHDVGVRKTYLRKLGKQNPNGNKRNVHHRQVGTGIESGGIDIAKVGALHHAHPRVLAQSPRKLAIPHVDRVHQASTALQQAVRESACRRPDVDGDTAVNRDLKPVERALQFEPASRSVFAIRPLHIDSHVRRDLQPGLVGPLTIHPHEPSHNRAPGRFPAGKQPSLQQQDVKPRLVQPFRPRSPRRGLRLRDRSGRPIITENDSHTRAANKMMGVGE